MFSTKLLRALLLALTLGTLVSACAKEDTPMPAHPALDDPRLDSIVLGMGCFWGAEKRMSELPGVVDVESGYANGEGMGNYQAKRYCINGNGLRFVPDGGGSKWIYPSNKSATRLSKNCGWVAITSKHSPVSETPTAIGGRC